MNIIFYPLILLCAYGISLAVGKFKKLIPVIVIAYVVSSVLFLVTYFTDYAEESKQYYNRDFLDAVVKADGMEEYDRLYITGNLGWQFNQSATEILTQYACKIDAQYYQSEDYAQRYHYIYPEKFGAELVEIVGDGLMVLYEEDLEYLQFPYEIIDEVGEYSLVVIQG